MRVQLQDSSRDALLVSAAGTPTFSPPCGAETTGRVPYHVSGSRDRGVLWCGKNRYGGWVLWLSRPPYLRWMAAVSLVVAAFAWDASERATEPFPFAAVDLIRGQAITSEQIVWRAVPTGSLMMPSLTGVSPLVPINAGDPIVPSLVSSTPPLPPGSWAVPVSLPLGTGPGMLVKLVFVDGTAATGIVIRPATEDSLGLVSDGLVAVQGEMADSVALAASNGDLVVLIEP